VAAERAKASFRVQVEGALATSRSHWGHHGWRYPQTSLTVVIILMRGEGGGTGGLTEATAVNRRRMPRG